LISDLFRSEKFNFEFNGNTRNPPAEVRSKFRDNSARELIRDNRTTIYNGKWSASPHSFNDKSGIVYLYKKEGVLDELSSLTISCDINIDELEERGMPMEPCHECWWCRERQWGFEANNCIDKSQLKSS
jgi:7-cyano-7-deazaguanine synthase in queuosine biosynthesis